MPDELSSDTERVARFEREAKLLAALNHPNVATLHGLEESDGRRFLVMELVQSGESTPFLATAANELQPVFSPDGRLIAYISDESGRNEIYVRTYPGADRKEIVSTNGGDAPRWSSATGELFYKGGDSLMGVAITTDPDLALGRPYVVLAETSFESSMYDVPPTVRAFFFTRPTGGSTKST